MRAGTGATPRAPLHHVRAKGNPRPFGLPARFGAAERAGRPYSGRRAGRRRGDGYRKPAWGTRRETQGARGTAGSGQKRRPDRTAPQSALVPKLLLRSRSISSSRLERV